VKINDVVQLRGSSGNPVKVGDVTVTPRSQALIVRWPMGGFVWNRPVSVVIERDGQQERLPILDVTRWTQVRLLVLCLAFSIIAWTVSVWRNRTQREK
jgi:hypothetical protein